MNSIFNRIDNSIWKSPSDSWLWQRKPEMWIPRNWHHQFKSRRAGLQTPKTYSRRLQKACNYRGKYFFLSSVARLSGIFESRLPETSRGESNAQMPKAENIVVLTGAKHSIREYLHVHDQWRDEVWFYSSVWVAYGRDINYPLDPGIDWRKSKKNNFKASATQAWQAANHSSYQKRFILFVSCKSYRSSVFLKQAELEALAAVIKKKHKKPDGDCGMRSWSWFKFAG